MQHLCLSTPLQLNTLSYRKIVHDGSIHYHRVWSRKLSQDTTLCTLNKGWVVATESKSVVSPSKRRKFTPKLIIFNSSVWSYISGITYSIKNLRIHTLRGFENSINAVSVKIFNLIRELFHSVLRIPPSFENFHYVLKLGPSTKSRSLNTILAVSGGHDVIVTFYEN